MDDKGREMFTFQVSAEEAESINAAVRESGLSRSEFLRQRMTNPAEAQASVTGNTQPSKDVTVLLQHVVYGLHALHAAVYAIAEQTGTLTAAHAEKILNGSLANSRGYLAHLDEKITAVRQQIKFPEAEPQIKKPAREIKADGLSRSV